MADKRRSQQRRSGSRSGASGPGRRPTVRRVAQSGQPRNGSGRGSATPRGGAGSTSERRPRFTGRAGILVLVLAVLAVSYASSLRAYLEQRSAIDDLKGQISSQKRNIDDLEREKSRWQDPAFVEAQARARFGYVKKGDTPFVVIGTDGQPLDSEARLSEPTAEEEAPPAWYDDTWSSMVYAGNPPRKADPPAEQLITGQSGSGD